MRSNCVVHRRIRKRGACPEEDHGRGLALYFRIENVVPSEFVVRRRPRPRDMFVQPIPHTLNIGAEEPVGGQPPGQVPRMPAPQASRFHNHRALTACE
ncbi:MAG: hypothetical protein GY774_27330 [Planctomycetes bacterium]|nr:hypothetical protein [Planctomycetota bacterium]